MAHRAKTPPQQRSDDNGPPVASNFEAFQTMDFNAGPPMRVARVGAPQYSPITTIGGGDHTPPRTASTHRYESGDEPNDSGLRSPSIDSYGMPAEVFETVNLGRPVRLDGGGGGGFYTPPVSFSDTSTMDFGGGGPVRYVGGTSHPAVTYEASTMEFSAPARPVRHGRGGGALHPSTTYDTSTMEFAPPARPVRHGGGGGGTSPYPSTTYETSTMEFSSPARPVRHGGGGGLPHPAATYETSTMEFRPPARPVRAGGAPHSAANYETSTMEFGPPARPVRLSGAGGAPHPAATYETSTMEFGPPVRHGGGGGARQPVAAYEASTMEFRPAPVRVPTSHSNFGPSVSDPNGGAVNGRQAANKWQQRRNWLLMCFGLS